METGKNTYVSSQHYSNLATAGTSHRLTYSRMEGARVRWSENCTLEERWGQIRVSASANAVEAGSHRSNMHVFIHITLKVSKLKPHTDGRST